MEIVPVGKHVAVGFAGLNVLMTLDVHKDSCAKKANAWQVVARLRTAHQTRPVQMVHASIPANNQGPLVENQQFASWITNAKLFACVQMDISENPVKNACSSSAARTVIVVRFKFVWTASVSILV